MYSFAEASEYAFPTPVGMNRGLNILSLVDCGVPHARGDEPTT